MENNMITATNRLLKLDAGLSQKTVKDFLIVLKMIYRYGVKINEFQHCDWNIKYPNTQENKAPDW